MAAPRLHRIALATDFHKLLGETLWMFDQSTCRLARLCRGKSMARNFGVPRHTAGAYRASRWPLLTLTLIMIGLIEVATHLRDW